MITVLLERDILKGQLLYTGVQRSGLENNLSSSNQEVQSLKVRLTKVKSTTASFTCYGWCFFF